MEALGDLDRGLHLKRQGLECDSTSAFAHVQIASRAGISVGTMTSSSGPTRRSIAIHIIRSLVNCWRARIGSWAISSALPRLCSARVTMRQMCNANLAMTNYDSRCTPPSWRPRRSFRASSTCSTRATRVGSSRRGASVGQPAPGSAVQPVPRQDEIAAGKVTGPVKVVCLIVNERIPHARGRDNHSHARSLAACGICRPPDVLARSR